MERIIGLIKQLDAGVRQDLITFLVLNYPMEANNAGKYVFWPNSLKKDASERLRELMKTQGEVAFWRLLEYEDDSSCSSTKSKVES